MNPSRISRCIGHQSSMSCVTTYRSNRVALFTRRGDPEAWGKAPGYVNGVSEGVSFPYRPKYPVALRGVSDDRGTSKVLTTRDSRSELQSPLTVRSFLARSEKTNQKSGATPKAPFKGECKKETAEVTEQREQSQIHLSYAES